MPKIILGALLLHTLDIKIACLIPIFNLVLILLLIIFTKKLHLRCLARSWICLYRSSHLRGVLENRCFEICGQNFWKIPIKKFIFREFAGWQSATFNCIPWGFYLIYKEIFENCFFAGFFLRWKLLGTLLKANFFKDILQVFLLKISPGNFKSSCL